MRKLSSGVKGLAQGHSVSKRHGQEWNSIKGLFLMPGESQILHLL